MPKGNPGGYRKNALKNKKTAPAAKVPGPKMMRSTTRKSTRRKK